MNHAVMQEGLQTACAEIAGLGFMGLLFFLLILLPAAPTTAADLSPTYGESLTLAIAHADNPAGWQPASLFVIPDPGGTQGLQYDGTALIVRTASYAKYLGRNFVGQAGQTVFGGAQTDAAWVTTGNDATRFLLANRAVGATVTGLLERGLGMNQENTHDVIIEYSVDPSHLLRPTRNPDISQYLPAQYGTNRPFVQPAGMSDALFNDFKAYYENWFAGAYGKYKFPWTQLGYTFFWGNGYTLGEINGMSEFILLGGTPIAYHGIYATQSYLYTRNDGADFSTAPSSQFGNGFASFRIDGTCDTVWAGHRFQKNVRTAAAAPNKLIVSTGGSISGGQGILIWSLNYDVENSGVITGATAGKFGLANTADIALLFRGDTSNTWGTPITAGVNRLTNAGTIASPGTAVLAEAGDTIVTNHAGGLISGGRCAIQTGPGADTIVVNGGRIEGGEYAIRTGAGNDTVTIFGGGLVGRVDLGTGTDVFNVATGGVRLGVALRRDTADTARILVKDGGAGTVTLADNTVVAVQAGGGAAICNNDRFVLVDTDNLTVNPTNLVIENAAFPMVRFSAEKNGGKLLLVAARDGAYYGRGSGNASLGEEAATPLWERFSTPWRTAPQETWQRFWATWTVRATRPTHVSFSRRWIEASFRPAWGKSAC